MIAYFELDLVLHAATCEKKKKKVKKVKTARKPCGSAVRLKEEKFAKKQIGGGHTRQSVAGFSARNGFRTRCASDLISGTFAPHVFETGVRRCAYLDGITNSFRFGETNEYDQKKG